MALVFNRVIKIWRAGSEHAVTKPSNTHFFGFLTEFYYDWFMIDTFSGISL